jgi:insertion element IS1 protein InsB
MKGELKAVRIGLGRVVCKITISITCPHCRSSKIWKNGHKKNGRQNFLCGSCRKQFQQEYTYKGCCQRTGKQVVKMFIRNSGLRHIEYIAGVHRQTALSILTQKSEELKFRHWQNNYESVQIDELYSFVGSKENKQWFIYAYAPETDEVLAWQWGDRSQATVERLYQQLKGLDVKQFYTDDWKAFSAVLPADRHQIGKAGTKHIEGVNTSLRTRNRRFVRRTCCFSKKQKYHGHQLRLILFNRNYHTI